MLYAASLPAFGHRAELSHILRHVGRWAS